MHCEKAEMLLPLLVFDEIEDGEKAELLAHLSQCGSCSEKLGDLRVTLNLLREGIDAQPVPMLSQVKRTKLMKKLAKEPRGSKRKQKTKSPHAARGPFRFFAHWSVPRRVLAVAASLAMVTALTGLMLPSLGSARRTARQMQNSTQGRGIHSGLVLQAQENGQYADNLGDLVDGNYVSPEYFISPSDTRNIKIPDNFQSLSKQQKADWVNDNSSYAFVRPGEQANNDSRRIVLFEKPSPGQQGISVVYDDNHAVYMPMDEAAKEIKANTGKSLGEWNEALSFNDKLRKAEITNNIVPPPIIANPNGDVSGPLSGEGWARSSGGGGGDGGGRGESELGRRDTNAYYGTKPADRTADYELAYRYKNNDTASESRGKEDDYTRNTTWAAKTPTNTTRLYAEESSAESNAPQSRLSSAQNFNTPLAPPILNASPEHSLDQLAAKEPAKSQINERLYEPVVPTLGPVITDATSDDLYSNAPSAKTDPRANRGRITDYGLASKDGRRDLGAAYDAPITTAKPGRAAAQTESTAPSSTPTPVILSRSVDDTPSVASGRSISKSEAKGGKGIALDLSDAEEPDSRSGSLGARPGLQPATPAPDPVTTADPSKSDGELGMKYGRAHYDVERKTANGKGEVDSKLLTPSVTLAVRGTTVSTGELFDIPMAQAPRGGEAAGINGGGAGGAGPAVEGKPGTTNQSIELSLPKGVGVEGLDRGENWSYKAGEKDNKLGAIVDGKKDANDVRFGLEIDKDNAGPFKQNKGKDATWFDDKTVDSAKKSGAEWDHITNLNGVYLKIPAVEDSSKLDIALDGSNRGNAPGGAPAPEGGARSDSNEYRGSGQKLALTLNPTSSDQDRKLNEALDGFSVIRIKESNGSLSFGSGVSSDAGVIGAVVVAGAPDGDGTTRLSSDPAQPGASGNILPPLALQKSSSLESGIRIELAQPQDELQKLKQELRDQSKNSEEQTKSKDLGWQTARGEILLEEREEDIGLSRELKSKSGKNLFGDLSDNVDRLDSKSESSQAEKDMLVILGKRLEDVGDPVQSLARFNRAIDGVQPTTESGQQQGQGQAEGGKQSETLAQHWEKTSGYFDRPQSDISESSEQGIPADKRELTREYFGVPVPTDELLVAPQDWPKLTAGLQVENITRQVYGIDDLLPDSTTDEDRAVRLVERTAEARDLSVNLTNQLNTLAANTLDNRVRITNSDAAIVVVGNEKDQAEIAKVITQFREQQSVGNQSAVRAPDAAGDDRTELQPAANFRMMPVNPWTLAAQDSQSTFALDVDTASYTLGRRYIQRGYLPPAGSVRMEEYINAFDYNYVNNSDQVFRIDAAAAPAPFANPGEVNTKLIKVGVKGKVIGRDGRKPANLVLVVDTSGSMARADRLPLIQHSLELLTSQLSPHDTVSLVTFGSQVMTLLEQTPASNKDAILTAIRSLQANGPTNLLKGVEAGYKLAERAHRSGSINRIILCSDGIATLGETEADTILGYVENYRKQGISCTAVGFGAGAYDDDMMEKLANKGDGSYHFVDTQREARKVFVDDLTATLQTIAKDAKIQVEFNPQRVRRYRLIGYENRAIADKDFRNDTIDAGEVGSGQSSTALYEVELIGDERANIGTVYVRYRNADSEKIEEISQRLSPELLRDRTPKDDPRFYLAACAAEFAELLRGSEHAVGGNLPKVQAILEQTVPQLPLDEKARELLDLVRKAQGLPRAP